MPKNKPHSVAVQLAQKIRKPTAPPSISHGKGKKAMLKEQEKKELKEQK